MGIRYRVTENGKNIVCVRVNLSTKLRAFGSSIKEWNGHQYHVPLHESPTFLNILLWLQNLIRSVYLNNV